MSKKTAEPVVTVTNNDGLLAMARDAEDNNRNRQVDTESLAAALDPEGVHVLELRMPHEYISGKHADIHWRTLWLVNIKGTDEPVRLFMDVSPDVFDAETFESGLI